MLASFAWGFAAAATLIVGGAFALRFRVGERALGLVMAFGSGVLISAVAFELVAGGVRQGRRERRRRARPLRRLRDVLRGRPAHRPNGRRRPQDSGGGQAGGSALAIVLGIVLDGIPESIVLGLTLLEGGGVSAAFLVAVFLSNVPEAIAATSGLAQAGWAKRRILGLWIARCRGVRHSRRSLGYALFDTASPDTIAFVLAFAGGAILTMLADTMMPEAFEHGGKLVGVVTTLGFGLAFAISALG